ncbi:lymphocyte expansion molecule-like [Ceratina calcarata]|uniref:Lymphocyte expansion molecule-like n=1 Tax=Ceratina calcarata TaxID=156304 RepID=A0AAJ7SD99_9HYME|nr:lymphocyte expansion molecule-like [Ceratina calcarata]
MSCGTRTESFKLCRCACRWRCQCLIPREKKPHPPFNVGSKRDVVIGLHPKLYKTSTDTPNVGTYDPQPIKTKCTASNWDNELKAEEFAATMGGKIPEKYLIEKDVLRRGRGPGTHEIVQWPDTVLYRPCKTIKRDVGFGGTVPLFQPSWPSTTPGPGYTRNPYRYIDRRRRRGSSCVPTFEYDGLRPRFPPVTTKSWILPCNLYDVRDTRTLDAVLNKVTGKRGPYDLFTGPRDDSTLRSYQATVKLEDRGDWPKSLPSELDKLLHKSNYFKGRFTTCPRFPKISGLRSMLKDLALAYKDPKQPGPGHYDPKSPRKPTSTKNYPFDINVEFVRPEPLTVLQPGPGRYKIRDVRTVEGNGWTFVFKSKAPRTKFIVIPTYNAF